MEVESLPRQLVLDHLTSVATDLTMPYLVSAWDVCELMLISLKPRPWYGSETICLYNVPSHQFELNAITVYLVNSFCNGSGKI